MMANDAELFGERLFLAQYFPDSAIQLVHLLQAPSSWQYSAPRRLAGGVAVAAAMAMANNNIAIIFERIEKS